MGKRNAAFLACMFLAGGFFVTPVHAADTLVAAGAAWNYLDTGADLGDSDSAGNSGNWAHPGFNDAGWLSGAAKLGYNDGATTTIRCQTGTSPNTCNTGASNKIITYYFRHSFTVSNPAQYNSLTLELLRDDGAIVYLNGTELQRSNMPSGNVTASTTASGAVGGGDESNFYQFAGLTNALVSGTNVLAVELHQANATSSDLGFNLRLLGETGSTSVTRGPYLQNQTPTSIVVRWRTAAATNSRVQWGSAPGSLTNTVDDAASTTEHEVTLTGLTPGATVYYSIGSTSETLAGADSDHFFVQPPTLGTDQAMRIWLLGDSGTANANARAVRDAYESFTGSTHTDLWVMLGDNAYNNGTDAEHQAAIFDTYPAMLRKSALWPTRGNHEADAGVYYGTFTLPTQAATNGLSTGVDSNTEAYYSFDYGNVHFIVLDSYGTDRSIGAAMLAWLENDLIATSTNVNSDWIIAYWHHPPYTKGTHNSDTESIHIEMRERATPILEKYGIDLVLGGHSHNYERSYFLDGHYGLSGTYASSTHATDIGNGRVSGDGAYEKLPAAQSANTGAVYVVNGQSGNRGGSTSGLNHPAMFTATTTMGSVVLDINGDVLDAIYLDNNQNQLDTFRIQKNQTAQSCSTVTLDASADTYINGNSAATNYGSATTLLVDGDNPDASALLKWDLSSIPSGSSIQSASVYLNISNASAHTYELYQLLRNWSEGQANWNQYSTGNNWQTAGGSGVSDREATSLGATGGINDTGFPEKIALNSTGLQLVADWANGSTNNYGLVLQDYGVTDGYQFDSSEGTEPPRLTVEYCPPQNGIGDTVFEDINGNGTKEAAEPGISGVSIDLIDASSSVVDTQTTNSNGFYFFTNPSSGNYTLDVTSTLAGYTLTTSNDPATVSGYTAGTKVDNVDFGYLRTGAGSIGGLVWDDVNGDGSSAGESGISNITVNLYRDLNNNDALDGADIQVTTTTTNASGLYDFSALPDAEYLVDVDETDTDLGGRSLSGGSDPAAVTLSGGADINNINAGFSTISCSTVNLDASVDTYLHANNATTNYGGATTLAVDGDPVTDERSVLIQWDVSTIPSGATINSASIRLNVTNASASSYSVYQALRNWVVGEATWNIYSSGNNWATAGAQGSGDLGTTSLGTTPGSNSTGLETFSLNASGRQLIADWVSGAASNYGVAIQDYAQTDSYQFDSGEGGTPPRLTVEYCVLPAIIGDAVYEDIDGDGSRDANEPGIGNVTVALIEDTDGQGDLDPGETTVVGSPQTTTAPGYYAFSGVSDGDYMVSVTDTNNALTGFTLTSSNEPFAVTNYTAGTRIKNADFGYRRTGTGSIGGLIWHDANSDGSSSGESGISGVTVDLYRDLDDSNTLNAGDAYVGTQTTNGSGNYDFTGLPNAEYLVDVTDTGNQLAGKIISTSGEPTAVTLGGSADINNIDFGYSDSVCTTVNLTSVSDTYIKGDDVNTNFGGTTPLKVDGSPDEASLIKWDVSTIPASAAINSVSLRLNVSNASADNYEVYQLLRNWVEGQATWNIYSAGNAWSSAGAQGATDRSATSLGASPGSNSTGIETFTLNVTARQLVADWRSGAANNYGVILQDYTTASDGYLFSSKEGSTAPTLIVEYCELYVPPNVGDLVWNDSDYDGVQDAGESGIGGVTVNLLNAALTQIDTTTTNSQGKYGFNALSSGSTYSVEIEVPAGFRLSPKDLGGDDAMDSDAIPATARTGAFVWNADDQTLDFGLYRAPGGAETVLCYAVADNGGNTNVDDLWSFEYSPATGAVTNAQELVADILSSTSDDNLESIEYDFARGKILAGGSGAGAAHHIVEIDPANSYSVTHWSAFSTGLLGIADDGSANGAENVGDIDGLAYDLFNDTWYASARDGDNGGDHDFIFAFDPVTRDRILGHFADCDGDGDNDDYLRPRSLTYRDIDGLAFNPFTGELVGIENQSATTNTRLFTIDLSDPKDSSVCTGETETANLTYENPSSPGSYLPLIDIEGIGVDREGNVLVTSGADGNEANHDPNTVNYVLSVNLSTGMATRLYQLDTRSTSNGDFEGVTCQTFNPYGPSDLGAVGNRVWIDENSNGNQDAGEPGLPGVTVQLIDPGPDGTFGNTDDQVTTTVTNVNGGYLFDGLVANKTYAVDIDTSSLPAGVSQSPVRTPAGSDMQNQDHSGSGYQVTIGSGQPLQNLTADFGYNWNPSNDVQNNTNSGAIGDRVWIDADGDGRQDPGEAGIPGVTVRLKGPGADGLFGTADDAVLATDIADAYGAYLFDALAVGAYQVEVDDSTFPAGYTWIQTGDPDEPGTTATNADHLTTSFVVLGPGDVYLNADFGYNAPEVNTIGDTVFLDSDGDGGDDTSSGVDVGIPGVTVSLVRDTNGNGKRESSEPVIAVDITDSNGLYKFPGLLDGDYVVWINDSGNVLSELEPSADPDGGLDNISAVDLDSGGANSSSVDNLDQDFGYTVAAHDSSDGFIGDTVFLDRDADGTFDVGEGIKGVSVELLNAAGTVVHATATTDKNGRYAFGNIDPTKTYIVRVVTSTLPAGLTNSVDPDGGTAHQSTVALNAVGGDGVNDTDGVNNGVNRGQDFGYVPTGSGGSIGNFIWEDKNADGNFDAGEPPIEGVTLDLFYDADGNGSLNAGDRHIGSTATDASGNYLFENLPTVDAGNGSGGSDYIVVVNDREDVVENYWHTTGTADTDNESQVDPYAVSLTSGSPNALWADFGFFHLPGELGDILWEDDGSGGGTAEDGIRNGSEPGISGAVVVLTITFPNGQQVELRTVTDQNGYYNFRNLLVDENYIRSDDPVTTTTSEGPVFTLSIDGPPGWVSTHTTATDNADANDQADDPSDEDATVYQGANDGTNDFGLLIRDWGDAPPSYGEVSHVVVKDLYFGLASDAELKNQNSLGGVAANGDDTHDGSDDEDGWSIIQTEGTMTATVIGTNLRNEAAMLCGYLDGAADGVINGTFDRAVTYLTGNVGLTDPTVGAGNEELCIQVPVSGTTSVLLGGGSNPASANCTGGQSFSCTLVWNPSFRTAATTYLRFRLTMDSEFFSNNSPSPIGNASNGEIEDYAFEFIPTFVSIGEVMLEGSTPESLLADLDVGDMTRQQLLTLLSLWDSEAALQLAAADREAILAALIEYLDPDGDGRVAVLRWDTLEERGTIGFFAERREQGSTVWYRINEQTLPALIDAPLGGEYWLADPEAASGVDYLYRLIEQEAWGSRKSYGPFPLRID